MLLPSSSALLELLLIEWPLTSQKYVQAAVRQTDEIKVVLHTQRHQFRDSKEARAALAKALKSSTAIAQPPEQRYINLMDCCDFYLIGWSKALPLQLNTINTRM